MKKIALILSALVIMLFSCKKEDIEPVNSKNAVNNNIRKDSVVTKNTSLTKTSKDTIVSAGNQNIPVVTTTQNVTIAAVTLSTMNINFLINPGSNNENLTFMVVNGNGTTVTTLSKKNLISVNSDSWACVDATNAPVYEKITRVSSIYKDNSFVPNKNYHLYVYIANTNVKTHDFTFQVDANGNIFNLQSQNITYVVDQVTQQQINDVALRCNKIIVNYRTTSEDPSIFN